jgi:predicted dehydrogenase
MIRIGLMSAAHIHAHSYADALRALPGAVCIGIADDDAERGRTFAQQHELTYFESYEALLDARPDGVIICSENVHHASLMKLAASAGVHIMTEKPFTTTLEDGVSALNTCWSAQVKLMTAFPMRFNPPMREVRDLIASGTLGQVYAMNGTNQGQLPKRHRAWFVDKALAGGGAMMDHIVHLADVMRWCLNNEAVEVYAQSNRILYAQDSDVETGGLVMITFADGVFATIDCSWSKPLAYPTWGGVTLDVIAEKGVVNANAFKQGFTVFNEAHSLPRYVYWGSDSDAGMVKEFVDSIREDRTPSVTGEDGLKATEIVIAAYRSAETGQPVRLPLQ